MSGNEMAYKNCQHCNQWRPLDIDEVCSWCGCRLSFHVEVYPAVVYQPASGHTVVSLNLNNYRSAGLRVETIECSAEGLLADGDKYQGIEIDTRQRIPLELNLQGVDFTKERWIELTVTAVPAGSEAEPEENSYREKTRFCLSAEPVLKIPEQPVKVVMDGSEELPELREISIEIERGALQVAQVRTLENVPWIKVAGPAKSALLAATLDEGAHKQIRVPFRILRKELMDEIGSSFPPGREFTVMVSGSPAQSEIRAGTVKIQLQYPPKLLVESARCSRNGGTEIWTLSPVEVLWDQREKRITESRILVENIGDAPLQIEDIRLGQDYPWARLGPRSLELGARGTNNPPSTASLYLTIDANQASRSHPESLEIKMTLKGGEGTPPTATIRVPLEYAELETFDGIMAIDFGTSTTTCAFQVDAEKQDARLEDEDIQIPGVPTAIYYEDWDETQGPIFKIGKPALLAGVNPAGTLVTEIKRRLGSPKPIEVRFAKKPSLIKEYKPEEIAAHFLGEYRRLMEGTLKRAVEECVITHPVFFLDSSVQALQKAFRNAGFNPQGSDEEEESNAILVEPVAAAFKFICEETLKTRENRQIRLAVFDFGGGTTDFTLMQVRYAFDGLVPQVLATIEEVGGERFGGHDVTLKFGYYLVKCWKKHTETDPGLRNVSIPLTLEAISQESDPNRRTAALQNRRMVLDQAEQAKLELSHSSQASVTLKLSQLEEFVFPVTLDELNQEIRDDLVYLVNSFKEMIGSNAARKLDVIVVSGNSSRLPLVLPLLEEAFPEVSIHPVPEANDRFPGDAKLKESIVNGLLEHAKIRRNVLKDFVLDDKSSLQIPNKLIVNIGVKHHPPLSLQAYFHEVINKRATLPTGWVLLSDSLRREMEIFLLAMGGQSGKAPLLISENGSRRWNSRIQPLGKISLDKLPRPEGGWKQCMAEVQVEENRSVHFRISQDGKPIHEQVLAPEVILD